MIGQLAKGLDVRRANARQARGCRCKAAYRIAEFFEVCHGLNPILILAETLPLSDSSCECGAVRRPGFTSGVMVVVVMVVMVMS
jgi:hypothetical protein